MIMLAGQIEMIFETVAVLQMLITTLELETIVPSMQIFGSSKAQTRSKSLMEMTCVGSCYTNLLDMVLEFLRIIFSVSWNTEKQTKNHIHLQF